MTLSVTLLPGAASEEKLKRLRDLLSGAGFQVITPELASPEGDSLLITIWTRADASNLSKEQRDLLQRTASAERLVSVLIEKTVLPPDIPDHPVVDLVYWRGAAENAFAKDLISTLNALAARRPPPKMQGPLALWRKKLFGGLSLAAIAAFLFAVAMNVLSVQNNLCSINFQQPYVSDLCGYLGLGEKPTRERRVWLEKEKNAWEALPSGDCAAINSFLDTYKDGAFADEAHRAIDTPTFNKVETWISLAQKTPVYVSEGDAFPSLAAAQDDARRRGQSKAAEVCETYVNPTPTDRNELTRVDLLENKPLDCTSLGETHHCLWDISAICHWKQRTIENRKVCGK